MIPFRKLARNPSYHPATSDDPLFVGQSILTIVVSYYPQTIHLSASCLFLTFLWTSKPLIFVLESSVWLVKSFIFPGETASFRCWTPHFAFQSLGERWGGPKKPATLVDARLTACLWTCRGRDETAPRKRADQPIGELFLLVLNAGNSREWSQSSLVMSSSQPPATHLFPMFSTSKYLFTDFAFSIRFLGSNYSIVPRLAYFYSDLGIIF